MEVIFSAVESLKFVACSFNFTSSWSTNLFVTPSSRFFNQVDWSGGAPSKIPGSVAAIGDLIPGDFGELLSSLVFALFLSRDSEWIGVSTLFFPADLSTGVRVAPGGAAILSTLIFLGRLISKLVTSLVGSELFRFLFGVFFADREVFIAIFEQVEVYSSAFWLI
jgi:hypothetical protein